MTLEEQLEVIMHRMAVMAGSLRLVQRERENLLEACRSVLARQPGALQAVRWAVRRCDGGGVPRKSSNEGEGT